MLTEDFERGVRLRARAALENQQHLAWTPEMAALVRSWTPEFTQTVQQLIATIDVESPGFCPYCTTGLCMKCAKCHFVSQADIPCKAFKPSKPECLAYKEAFALLHSQIDYDLEEAEEHNIVNADAEEALGGGHGS